ncbi:MAG: exosome complex protein Rrp4 [Candidatus ainarchaeum sp.]|nr:exosome complex protein Rrp4 [Candidatus ainarchaeum sp.]
MKKRIVIPGELVSEERKKVGPHVFVENGKIYSDSLGLIYNDSQDASVVALHGKYVPQRDDLIIGVVVQETFGGYIVDINSFYFSFVSKEFIRDRLQRGSIISAKIMSVNEINEAELGQVRFFFGGEIINISPVKVPRVIGKNASMMEALKLGTGANIMVGRNGRIWAKGGNTQLLAEAIKKIEAESHLSNLTNKIEAFLKEKNKGVKEGDLFEQEKR